MNRFVDALISEEKSSYEARIRAAKYNENLLTRAGAAALLPGVTEDSLKKYELDITRPPNIVVALRNLRKSQLVLFQRILLHAWKLLRRRSPRREVRIVLCRP